MGSLLALAVGVLSIRIDQLGRNLRTTYSSRSDAPGDLESEPKIRSSSDLAALSVNCSTRPA
eukprot:2438627-Amphidinium_carterae.1